MVIERDHVDTAGLYRCEPFLAGRRMTHAKSTPFQRTLDEPGKCRIVVDIEDPNGCLFGHG